MSDQPAPTLDFHVIQTVDHKTLYASGVYSSVTPGGLINLNFYVDRQPIPDFVSFAIDNGRLTGEKTRSIRNGIVREVQQGVVLDVSTVKVVINTLQMMVAAHEEAMKAEESDTQ